MRIKRPTGTVIFEKRYKTIYLTLIKVKNVY